MFGVGGAVQRAIARRIKRDQGLAEALWSTGNFDARILATLIADARAMPGRLLGDWIADVDCALLVDAVAMVAAGHPGASALSAGWRASTDAWSAAIGWGTLAKLVPQLADAEVPSILAEIERRASEVSPCVQDAMASVLVALAGRGDRMRIIATETARRLGRVGVERVAEAERGIEASVAHHAAKARPSGKAARPRRIEARPAIASAKAHRPRS